MTGPALPVQTADAVADLARLNGHSQTAAGPAPQDSPPRPALAFQTIAELCAEVDALGPRKWLIRGVWPAGAYGVHAAEPKAGKTWTAFDLAVSVASGTPWLGQYPIDAPGPVVVFAGEGGDGNVVRRLRAIAAARGLRLESLPIIVCTRAPHLADDGHMRELIAALDQARPVLVILDPLYLSAGGANGADLYEMGRLLERPQLTCERVGAALLVVHHYNRTRNLRGAARITGAGPAEWGRVLLSAQVVSRRTDPNTLATTVVVEFDVQGGEVPDRTFRVSRTVRAADPDDLDSPLLYAIEEAGSAVPSLADSLGLSPAHAKVLDALDAHRGDGEGVDLGRLGDWLAAHHTYRGKDGSEHKGLRRNTISEALTKLRSLDLADYIEPHPGGPKYWFRAVPDGDA
jgi:hypothetical protein